MRAEEFVNEVQRWPDIESAKRAFVANPRLQHLPASTRQAMGASAYQKQQSNAGPLADRLKKPPVPHWQDMDENFADGRGPGRPGDSVRHGIPKHATMAELEKASHASGRKGQLARWQLNMRRGKKRKHKA